MHTSLKSKLSILVALISSCLWQGCVSCSTHPKKPILSVQERDFCVSCVVHDEEGEPIEGACLFYGHEESLYCGGVPMCQIATANEFGKIFVDAIEVVDAGPGYGWVGAEWASIRMFIAAPGYAPVAFTGQNEVVLIKTEEFEPISYGRYSDPCSYVRLKGADPLSRILLAEIYIDVGNDVVKHGPGRGTSGEIGRRLAYLNDYVGANSPFMKRYSEYKTIVVYAIVDSGYQNAKLLGDKPYHYYSFGHRRRGIKKHPDRYRSPKARDYLPIHMKPEDVRKEEIEQN